MNCEKVFQHLVNETVNYMTATPSLKAMVLGISGGIDSTLCAAICYEVSKQTGIPLIGRSITMSNTKDEVNSSLLVGNAFCNDFKEININRLYSQTMNCFVEADPEYYHKWSSISRGNLQARLRMMYLYNIAGINSGLVIDTDNLTEHYLGFFTIHGDVGDFNPIGGLWKTEIYELVAWLVSDYYKEEPDKAQAISVSAKLLPTDGLGISKSDYDQIGASKETTDKILQTAIYFGKDEIMSNLSKFQEPGRPNCVNDVLSRMERTSYKRKKLPVVVSTQKEGLGTMESINIF